jgi:hypothetical protein
LEPSWIACYTPQPMVPMIAWSVAGLLSLLTLLFGSEPIQLASIAVLCLSALRLRDFLQGIWRRIPGWAGEIAGPILLVATITILYGRLLIGDFPVNHDHPVFLYRAWNTGAQILASGSFSGFSTMMFAGYPANALYPMGTDLLVCVLRAISFGLASWETAYCWALFLCVLSYPMALYALGRRFAGSWAGLAAGLLAIVDRGAWLQSGWHFNLDWGVWSMGLSFSLCLWSLWSLDRLLKRAKPGNFLSTAGFLAGAILCHPMAVPILGVTWPLYLAVTALSGKLGAPGLWLPRVVGASLLGFGLCAFWLIPFVGRSEWFEPLAYAWIPFEPVIRGVLDGTLLAQFGPGIFVAGVIGLILAIRQENSFAWFLLIVAGFLVFFASTTFLLAFGILDKFPSIAHLQLERFTYVIRTALLLGCGMLLQIVLKTSDPARSNTTLRSSLLRQGRRLLLVAMLAPFFLYMVRIGPVPYLAPFKPLVWSSESSAYKDLRAAADYLNAQDSSRLGRVVVMSHMHDHLLVSLPVYTGLPIFKVGFTPENNYRYKFESRDAKVWQAVNVSHVLSFGPTRRPDVTEEKRFGKLFLYRFHGFDPARAHLEGPGSVTVERDEPEAMDLRLDGTGPDSRLIVHTGRYALWEAELAGETIPISGASIGDSPDLFMALPGRDGLIRLRYRNGALEWTGAILSWLSLLVVLLVLAARSMDRVRRRVLAWVAPVAVPVRDATTLITLAIGALGIVYLVIRLLLPASPAIPGRRVVTDLSRHIAEANAEVVRPSGSQPCKPFDGARIRCPGPEWNYAGRKIIVAKQLLRQCIWLHPIQGAKFSLHFPDIPLGDHIQGYFGMDDASVYPPGHHDVNLTVLLDDSELGRFTCPSRSGWFAWEAETPGHRGTSGRITIQSDAPFTGRRHFCFTAYATENTD